MNGQLGSLFTPYRRGFWCWELILGSDSHILITLNYYIFKYKKLLYCSSYHFFPRMQVNHRRETARGGHHLPTHGLHVAAGHTIAVDVKSYKGGRRRGVNAPRRTLAHVMVAVMAGEIRSRTDGNSRNVAVGEQREYRALEPSGCPFSAEILYPYVWSFPQTRVIAGNLGVGNQSAGLWFWSASVCSITAQYPVEMVQPRQRMLSRRGSSRGGSARSQTTERTGHCCHCHLARSSGANPL